MMRPWLTMDKIATVLIISLVEKPLKEKSMTIFLRGTLMNFLSARTRLYSPMVKLVQEKPTLCLVRWILDKILE